MRPITKVYVTALGLLVVAGAASSKAQTIVHNQEHAESPYASSVVVPPGRATYYLSGAGPTAASPAAAPGTQKLFGDTASQTSSTLSALGARLSALGLEFADVVQARVYLVADPNNGGKMDFAAMNGAWLKIFGTPAQPNKPARTTVEVAQLPVPGALVEIELVAAK